VLCVLGPLHAEAGETAVELGGRKQRAVLAALLLRAGEVVPDDRLIDDVWGEQPPAAVGHSLEAYVSNLRRVLAPHGVAFERRGGGYRLDLGPASLDARVFETLVEQAASALAAGDRKEAARAAGEALSLWRGPVLAGTPLHRDGRAEVERLEELRARAFEIRVDADLALGRHADVVAELGSAVEADPYRQRLVAQLMLALYRTGRHAEALDVYERTRRALDSDLGLQPSEDLQRLAGQIVRQEPELRAPAGTIQAREEPRSKRRRRVSALAVVLLLAAGAISLGLVAFGGAAASHEGPVRVALIRMWDPGGPGGGDDAGWKPFVDGLLAAERTYGIETEIVDLFPRRPIDGGFAQGSPADVRRLSERLKSGDFDLVLWPQGLTGPNFFAVVPENPDTRFAFLDFCCVRDVGADSENATTMTLQADQGAHLAGYLSGLMETRRSRAAHRGHTFSMILGDPVFDQEQVYGQGFLAGVHRALPGATVLTDYSYEYDDRSTCESIANQQIDAGSHVVFAVAGECGIGALAAAGIRGAWAVGGDEDRAELGSHVLASVTKRFDRLTELSVSWYLEGRLPAGEDLELGLAEDAVALVSISPQVPLTIRRKVAQEATLLRAKDEASGSS
jgi:DNA-binding SARP family transcriptional activator/basic membrane lipoprotein Med (substrate-binding protein (PBP1-ABC) superfamily)